MAASARRAREVRHDIDRLRQRFGVSFEQACHRLSTLQRPGARACPSSSAASTWRATSPSATRRRGSNSPASAAPARSGWCMRRWRSPTASSSSSPRCPTARAMSRWPRGWSSRRAAMPAAAPLCRGARLRGEHAADFVYADDLARRRGDADRHRAAASARARTATSAPFRPPGRSSKSTPTGVPAALRRSR
jgi:hypothetical protein